MRNIQGVDVIQSSAKVDDKGKISHYRVNVKISFLVDAGGVG